MDKREQIGGALEPFYREVQIHRWKGWRIDTEALAEQAIVIECEVEHPYSHMSGKPYTYIRGAHIMGRHHGTPGKALAIIISLEE